MTRARPPGGGQVVVVESPAKARTLRKLLGPGHRVFATRGHVSDLPAKPGSVRPEDGFAMVYETGKGASRTLGAIAAALGRADSLVLATDPDREGEAIAWQVWTWLRENDALDGRAVHRVAFHEVTAAAVRAALARPRGLDMDLVRAQQARRALDYLVGFGLSPVLWRKVPGCRSAGRVQSVALRLVCAREAEIEAFAPRPYWSVEADVETGAGARLTARPARLDGTALERLSLASAAAGEAAAARIRAASFTVASVERATVRREPNPPFTTATLQQEAARRLGFGIRRTMELAQALYEGVELGAETEGLITYMRTDSVALSKTALAAARRTLRGMFAGEYLTARPRTFRPRRADVQEAHEAIRPTDFRRTPDSLAGRIEGDAASLYALIWRRALASQIKAARFERVDVEFASASGDVVLAASARTMAFDGHLRLYGDGAEEAPIAGGPAPTPVPGEAVRVRAVRTGRRATEPPPRYTEAALVRRLEELGIGRPSTWAAIVGVLQERQYVALANREFVPLERGRVATAFLERFFAPWVDYGFTAELETGLDRVAGGTADRDALLGAFWAGFDAALHEAGALERQAAVGAIEAALAGFVYGPGGEDAQRRCPACGSGTLGVRTGRRGLFVGCGRWPECGYRRPLAAAAGDGGYTGPKPLGDDPATGAAVTLRRGPHGWYVQRGDDDAGAGAKPERMSLPRAMDPEDIALDTALALLALPREVGAHPESGEPILGGIGRYGPWVRHRHLYAALGDDDDVLTIGLNRAVHLIAEKEMRESRARGPKRVLRELGPHPDDGAPVWLKTGHYGPFVAHRRRYASLPGDVPPDSLTLEAALALLGE